VVFEQRGGAVSLMVNRVSWKEHSIMELIFGFIALILTLNPVQLVRVTFFSLYFYAAYVVAVFGQLMFNK